MRDGASTLPAPMTPADCDLRDFEFMPLMVGRLRDSDMAAEESPEACWAAVRLWAASWHQVPAASVPDSDRILAGLAGYGRDLEGWLRVRDGALRHFRLCADGRLYHPVVARKALEAWIEKLTKRLAGGKGNAKRWGVVFDEAAARRSLDEAQRLLFIAVGSHRDRTAIASGSQETVEETEIKGADYPRVCARAGVAPVDNSGASAPSADSPAEDRPGGGALRPPMAAAPTPAPPGAGPAGQAVGLPVPTAAPRPVPLPAPAWPPRELCVEPALCGPPEDLDPQLQAQIDGRSRTPAGEVCHQLRAAGLPDPDPADPALAELLALGVGVDELLPLVDRAATKAHPFAWLLVTAISRRHDAARLRDTLPREAPTAQARASPTALPWWETKSGITARGVELGLGGWTEADWVAGRVGDFLAYRARVYAAAGPGPWHAAGRS